MSWIATANSVAHIPEPLLQRMEVKTVPFPREEHYPAIVRRAMAMYAEANNLHPAWFPEPTEVEWRWFKQFFTSPRRTRRAVELFLTNRLTSPGAGVRH